MTGNQNFNDTVAVALQGSDSYQVFDLDALRTIILPCYGVSVCAPFSKYRDLYRHIFSTHISTAALDYLTQMGQDLETWKDAATPPSVYVDTLSEQQTRSILMIRPTPQVSGEVPMVV